VNPRWWTWSGFSLAPADLLLLTAFHDFAGKRSRPETLRISIMISGLRSFLFLVPWIASAALTFAQGTSFTYEGRLVANGASASGSYDLQFTLRDSLVAGSQVGDAVVVPQVGVSNGLFVATLDFGSGVFAGANRWLEIGVRTNGAVGFVTLSPRQPVSATPYAITAGNVTGPINGSSIVNGSISGAQLATGAAAANLNASGQSGVASGGIVLSPTNNAALINAGYVKIGTMQESDVWQQRDNGVAPAARSTHTAVWTGSEMILWGGYDGTFRNDGARYNPVANTWIAMSTNGGPAGRFLHTAVWTGSKMIIWGGTAATPFFDGGRYDPVANAWTSVKTNTAPSARSDHSAVWTGSEMIICGGRNGGTYLADGARYNPAADGWTAIPLLPPPGGGVRAYHTAVWSGTEMIIWGGQNTVGRLNSGYRYSPAANSWNSMRTAGSPVARIWHTAVWTGTEMIIWGGENAGAFYNTGARYDPAGDFWTAVTANAAPAARRSHTAVWTGGEMIVWGGYDFGDVQIGGRYNPFADTWTPVSTVGSPTGRNSHTATWTGSEMIVWGGGDVSGSYLNNGGRYVPASDTWKATPATAPRFRDSFASVWTGTEMIVWGGRLQTDENGESPSVNEGHRYNPVANIWMPTTMSGAPSARRFFTGVWTGTEMIVWGGRGNSPGNLNDGGRYNAAADSWASVTTIGAPSGRQYHSAVWTGNEMIIWGGSTNSTILGNGARYSPTGNSWIPISLTAAPASRAEHTAVWTGSEMIVWGGYDIVQHFKSGGRYRPASDTWTSMSQQSAPSERSGHTAIWTGSEMLIWGGSADDGGRYDPVSDGWRTISSDGAAPSGHTEHTAVWTGSEMIVWGGWSALTSDRVSSGARYSPAANMWTAVETAGCPPARVQHAAAWTGTEMLIWGGVGRNYYNDTFSYTPGRVMYLYQRP
jgi:N-acetylneuraminic acid mutarotase